MTTQTITIISTGFEQGFSLKDPATGKIRKFGACTHHDDDCSEVYEEDGRFYLQHLGSRDDGFPELGTREELPPSTLVTYGYHPEERGAWATLRELRNLRGGMSAKPEPRPRKNPHAVALGSLGGRVGGLAKGPRKARTPEQARAAALARWEKWRAERRERTQTSDGPNG